MNDSTKKPGKLVLATETILKIKTGVRAGNDGPSIGCSAKRDCPRPPPPAPPPPPRF